MLYPPGIIVVLVRTVCVAFCVSTPSDDQRGPLCREVCWRKLAGTEDPPSHPSESTGDRPARRLRVDDSIGNVTGVPIGRSLARRPPAAAGMATRLGDNLQSLAPALHFHLQASSKWTYAYTTRSHRTPPIGVQSQGTHNSKFIHTVAGNRILA